MVEVFDGRAVSFVAVTQQFNTTTSMGRQTLNVLLSFAQFERGVTGERIRDKSRPPSARAWEGGVPPLGYDVRARRLVINPLEAETVRHIYERYLELGCVRQLSRELTERGTVSKVRISKQGIKSGGCQFRVARYTNCWRTRFISGRSATSRNAIRASMKRSCRANSGRVFSDACAPMWCAAWRSATSATAGLLAGKIFDADGEPLYAQGAAKAGRRYRYYVSRNLVNGTAGEDRKGWRLAAPELERAVTLAA